MQRRRLVVGISGATGTAYGIRLLQVARALEIETHLVITKAGARTLAYETDVSVQEVRSMADHSYPDSDIGAAIASGSFPTIGMVVAPCSVHSLAEIAHCTTDGLLTRAADVCLKERRRLVLLFRETPLHAGHIRGMASSPLPICPRCRSATTKTRSVSPVAGVWTVFGCDTCFYTWRSTEPAENTDPDKYPEVFRINPEDLGNLAKIPAIPPLRGK